MTLSMEQFRERLIDYLYGELDAEAQKEFEACLVESAECRRELAALQSTLRTARSGLLPVDREAPPARVRAAVLAAAREAKHASGSRPVALPVRAHKERASVWHWLRTPWLVPTFGVAAAVALLVLGRRIEPLRMHPPKEHETTILHNAPAPASGATAPSEPRASQPADVAEDKLAAAPSRDEGVRRLPGRGAGSAASRARAPAKSKGFAVPPPEWPAERAAEPVAQPTAAPSLGAGSAAKRGAAPETQRASRAVAPESVETRESEVASVPAQQVARDDARGLGGALSAQAAPPAAAPRPAAARAAARARGSNEFADEARPAAAAAPAAPPPAVAPALPLDALLRRAQEHFAAQRFREAASDYRALLRSYPTDPRVPAWRKSLALATEAARDAGAQR